MNPGEVSSSKAGLPRSTLICGAPHEVFTHPSHLAPCGCDPGRSSRTHTFAVKPSRNRKGPGFPVSSPQRPGAPRYSNVSSTRTHAARARANSDASQKRRRMMRTVDPKGSITSRYDARWSFRNHPSYPKNPDPQTHRVWFGPCVSRSGPTPAMESPGLGFLG